MSVPSYNSFDGEEASFLSFLLRVDHFLFRVDLLGFYPLLLSIHWVAFFRSEDAPEVPEAPEAPDTPEVPDGTNVLGETNNQTPRFLTKTTEKKRFLFFCFLCFAAFCGLDYGQRTLARV